ncbi:MAG: DUF1552 domain-containing protein [Pirellulales bacterium]
MQQITNDRRHFLKCASYGLALPFLSSLPGLSQAKQANTAAKAKRLVCVGTQLGFYKPEFFAEGQSSQLMQPLEDAGLSGNYTTISGLDHKGPTGNGHELVYTLYTGHVVPSISLDQLVAPKLGTNTRYESLQLCAGEAQARASLSFTPSGVPMPVMLHPSVVYAQIFGAGSVALKKQTYLIESGKSLLDELTGEAKTLRTKINNNDQQKLDEYFSSIRGLEEKLKRRRDWLDRPYPSAPDSLQMPEPEVIDASMLLVNEDLMWDLMALAIKNDSTRVISMTIPITDQTLMLNGQQMKASYHNISHHGKKPDKIKQLLSIEGHHMQGAARFLKSLKDTPEGDGTNLLDSTITMVGSAMADAAAHRRTNFPLMIAGGGFNHKKHISCGTGAIKNEMACDLYVSVLQQLGFETDQFSSSTSDLNEVLS